MRKKSRRAVPPEYRTRKRKCSKKTASVAIVGHKCEVCGGERPCKQFRKLNKLLCTTCRRNLYRNSNNKANDEDFEETSGFEDANLPPPKQTVPQPAEQDIKIYKNLTASQLTPILPDTPDFRWLLQQRKATAKTSQEVVEKLLTKEDTNYNSVEAKATISQVVSRTQTIEVCSSYIVEEVD